MSVITWKQVHNLVSYKVLTALLWSLVDLCCQLTEFTRYIFEILSCFGDRESKFSEGPAETFWPWQVNPAFASLISHLKVVLSCVVINNFATLENWTKSGLKDPYYTLIVMQNTWKHFCQGKKTLGMTDVLMVWDTKLNPDFDLISHNFQ